MNEGVSLGESILIGGEVVNINEWEEVVKDGKLFDTILSGGGYSASDTLLGVSYVSGRHSLVNELKGGDYHSIKVGRFRGETIASYIKMYLEGNYQVIPKEINAEL